MVSSTSRPNFTPGKDSVSIIQEAGWAPGQVWTGEKSRPHWDSIPDRPARSQSLYRLSYPTQITYVCIIRKLRYTFIHYSQFIRSTSFISSYMFRLIHRAIFRLVFRVVCMYSCWRVYYFIIL